MRERRKRRSESKYGRMLRQFWSKNSFLVCAWLCCIFPISTLALYHRVTTGVFSLVVAFLSAKQVLDTTTLSLVLCAITVSLSEIYFINLDSSSPRPEFIIYTAFVILRKLNTIQSKSFLIQFVATIAYFSYLTLRLIFTSENTDHSRIAETILWFLITIFQKDFYKQSEEESELEDEEQPRKLPSMGLAQQIPILYSPHGSSGHSIVQQTPRLLIEMAMATQSPVNEGSSSSVNYFMTNRQGRQDQPAIQQFGLSNLISFEQMTRESGVGIAVINGDLEILFSNQSLLSLLGDCKQIELKSRLFQWEFTDSNDQLNLTEDIYSVTQQTKQQQQDDDYKSLMGQQAFDCKTLPIRNRTKSKMKQQQQTLQAYQVRKSKTLGGVRGHSKSISGVTSISNVMHEQSMKVTTEMKVSTRFELSHEENKPIHQSKNRLAFALSDSVQVHRLDLKTNVELIEGLRSQSIHTFLELLAILLDPSNYDYDMQKKAYRSDEVLDYMREPNQLSQQQQQQQQQQSQKQRTRGYSNWTASATMKSSDRRQTTATAAAAVASGLISSRFDYQIIKNTLQLIVKSEWKQKKEKEEGFMRIQLKVFQRNYEEIEILAEIVDSSILPSCVIERSEFDDFKQRILSSVSHELRTPLNCSMQLLEIMQRSDILNETQKKMFVTPVINSNNLLLCMINDILDFSQILSGNLRLTFKSFNLLETIRECIAYFSFSAAFKSISIGLSVDSSIPSLIHTDATRFKQVMINLLSNAVKFTNKGSIQVSADPLGQDLIKLSVRDTGCGIPPHLGNKIFMGLDPQFLQQKNKRRQRSSSQSTQALNTRGAGLGLAIANTIAKGLGGNRQIEFESELQEGSLFSFFILNRSKSSKGCYFQHQKVFSNTFSNWRTLPENQSNHNSDVPMNANNSFEQTSIGQLDKRPSKQAIMYPQPSIEIRRKNTSAFNQKRKSSNGQIDSEERKAADERDRSQLSQSTLVNNANTNNNILHNSPCSSGLLLIFESQQQKGDNIAPSRIYPSLLQPPCSASDISSRNSQISAMKANYNSVQRISIEPILAGVNKNTKDIEDESCEITTDSMPTISNIQQSSFYPTCRRSIKQWQQYQQQFQHAQIQQQQSKQFHQMNSRLSQYNTMSKQVSCIGGGGGGGHKKIKDPEVEELQMDIQSFLHSTVIQQPSEHASQSSHNQQQSRKQMYYSPDSVQPASATTLNNHTVQTIRRYSTEISDLVLAPISKIRQCDTVSPPKRQQSPNLSYQPSRSTSAPKKNTVSEESLSLFAKANEQQHQSNYMKKSVQESTKDWIKRKAAMRSCSCADILVVDDNEFNVYALSLRLADYGFIIEKAFSGFTALDIIKDKLRVNGNSFSSSGSPESLASANGATEDLTAKTKGRKRDSNNFQSRIELEEEQQGKERSQLCCHRHKLIFMDIDMPEMNGHETTIEILSIFAQNSTIPPPITACTAFVSDQERALAAKAGMSHYLTKPVNTTALEEILVTLFDNSSESLNG